MNTSESRCLCSSSIFHACSLGFHGMKSPSLETFRSRLDVALGTLLGVSLLEQGLGQGPPEGRAGLACL